MCVWIIFSHGCVWIMNFGRDLWGKRKAVGSQIINSSLFCSLFSCLLLYVFVFLFDSSTKMNR